MSSSAVAELSAGFEVPFAALGHDAEQDRSAVVISWPSVPVEIVRATGFRPVVARGIAAPTPAADAVLEEDLFPSRIRQLVEAALTGRLAHVAAIVAAFRRFGEQTTRLQVTRLGTHGIGSGIRRGAHSVQQQYSEDRRA